MKRLFTYVLALVMALSLSVTAFAATIEQGSADPSGSTNVTYTVAPTYTVTIPASVTLGGSVEVKTENVVVPKGKQVVVKLTGTSGTDNAFKLQTDDGAELVYTVRNGENVVNINDAVLTVNPQNADNGSTTLTFDAPASVTYAGIYSGTVTFTVSVVTVS